MNQRAELTLNLMDGGHMARDERLEKIARLKADRDEVIDDIQRLVVARSETRNAVIDRMLLSRIDRKWAELDHINRNIRNVELGHAEMDWVEPDRFEDLGPDEGAPLH